MGPIEPRDFMLYWAVTLGVALLLIFRRPRRRGVRLRLLGQKKSGGMVQTKAAAPAPAPAGHREAPVAAPRERRLNVVFQFNGESWDAYEVLGLPAGSNGESVRAAFRESLEGVDAGTRPFIEAAYRAITAATGA